VAWHFEEISDDDLRAAAEIFTAGLLDRVARMKEVRARRCGGG
jgi:hypothetical protein